MSLVKNEVKRTFLMSTVLLVALSVLGNSLIPEAKAFDKKVVKYKFSSENKVLGNVNE